MVLSLISSVAAEEAFSIILKQVVTFILAVLAFGEVFELLEATVLIALG